MRRIKENRLENRHVVVIDDAESIRKFLRISLETHGATVDTTATGAAGLALCEQSPPDLVILDLGLPDHEGLDMLPRIKRISKHLNLPVIVLTAYSEPKRKETALRLGADAYMTKPFLIDDLIRLIEEHLQPPTLRNAS